jgi:hypothetical protein
MAVGWSSDEAVQEQVDIENNVLYLPQVVSL